VIEQIQETGISNFAKSNYQLFLNNPNSIEIHELRYGLSETLENTKE